MVYQRQHQQSTNGCTDSKAPLLVLGAAAFMIQGLLVLPTTANAETTINIIINNNNNNSNNNDASVVANSKSGKVSFDLGVYHNLQTIAFLSTRGSGPAGAGPQLWRTTSAAATVSHSNNATTPATLQQRQEQAQEQQKDTLENASSALYRKIRLDETSDASVTVDSTKTTPTAAIKNVGVVEEAEDIQSGQTDPVIDGDDLENEVASAEKESGSRNTHDASSFFDAVDTKKDDKKDDVTAVSVAEEESLPVILDPVSLSTPSTDFNDEEKKSNKKTAAPVVEEEKKKKANDDDDDADVQSENDKSTTADETEIETETEADTAAKKAAGAETPRVGDQVVLDKDGHLVKDVILNNEVEKKNTDVSSAEKNGNPTAAAATSDNTSKPLKPEEDEQEEEDEEEEEEEEEKKGPKATGDKKGDEDKEANEDEDDKEAEEAKKDESVTVVPEGGRKKKTNHREQAFAKLREQLLKQQQQQPSTEMTDTTEAPVEPDQVTDATTPGIVENGITTLARAADFVPPEDMRAVMNAKAEKDKKENKKAQSPLTPQQIADTEHQGANAFFELFAANVFPNIKLVGNNQLQDLDFEQRLNKQKEDKKVKAAKKKQQQQDKKGDKKQQQDRHQNEKRAIAAVTPEMTEKERIHAALESIFGKDGAAEIEAEADDSADVEITAQGLDKGIFAIEVEAGAAADADANGENAKIIDFDQDLDDEPIGILGTDRKEHHKEKHHHKKKHHHKHHAKPVQGDATTAFTTDDDTKGAKNTKDTKDDNNLTPPADSLMSKPSAGGPSDRTILGPSAGQPQPQQHQPQQPAPGAASPASPSVGASPESPSAGAPPAGAKDGPVTPSKGETGTAGTVPMFGPAQLDLGNSAASLLASRGSIALAFVFGVAWMVL
ncbi:hypothetical protein BGZ47_001921 [Haplosporangium gracile]|nr:hypothetical protein BGZ47_001921 [Haplosporangium gracile]